MLQRIFTLVLGCCLLHIASAQNVHNQAVKKYINQQKGAIVCEFAKFLQLPNTAGDTTGLRRNTDFITQMMRQKGITNIQLPGATTSGVPPAVYGEVLVPAAKRTIIFYAHYDGQPVNPAQWSKPL